MPFDTNPFDAQPMYFIQPKGRSVMANQVCEPIVVPTNAIKFLRELGGGICPTKIVEYKRKQLVQKFAADQCLLTEHLASYVCDALGFNFVPKTYFCRSDDWSFFSLQKFVQDAKVWHEVKLNERSQINRNELTMIYLFDYLIQNEDRHGSNFMVTKNNKPIAIDHHLTFSDCDKLIWVCYEDYINNQLPLNEFAYRLNQADLSKLSALSGAEYEMFRARASKIAVNAWRTVSEFTDTF